MSQSEHLHISLLDSKLGRLEARLARIADMNEMPPALLKPDLEYVVTELIRLASAQFNIASLDRRLAATLNVDFDALENAVTLLTAKSLKPNQIHEQWTINPEDLLDRLSSALKRLKAQKNAITPFALNVQLELAVDSYFNELLICAAAGEIDVRDIVSLLGKKLQLATDDEISGLWGRLTREFSEERLIEVHSQ